MLLDAKLMINGKELKTQIEIDETVLESVQSKEKVDRGYGEQVAYSPYSYVDNVGSVKTESDRGWEIDDLRFATANYYSSEEVARNNARADKLMRQLRRFAVENRKDKAERAIKEFKDELIWYFTEYKDSL